MTQLLIDCMEILFLKLAGHYFWPGITALPKNTSPNKLGYLFCFILISWGWLTSPTFFLFFAMTQFDWPIPKKVETMETP